MTVIHTIDDLSNKYQSVPIAGKANGSSSSTPTTTLSKTKLSPIHVNNPPTKVQKQKASQPQQLIVLLKGKDGSIVVKGTVLPGLNTIHGHPCKDNCHVVAVTDIVQIGAQPWFEDRFDEAGGIC